MSLTIPNLIYPLHFPPHFPCPPLHPPCPPLHPPPQWGLATGSGSGLGTAAQRVTSKVTINHCEQKIKKRLVNYKQFGRKHL